MPWPPGELQKYTSYAPYLGLGANHDELSEDFDGSHGQLDVGEVLRLLAEDA